MVRSPNDIFSAGSYHAEMLTRRAIIFAPLAILAIPVQLSHARGRFRRLSRFPHPKWIKTALIGVIAVLIGWCAYDTLTYKPDVKDQQQRRRKRRRPSQKDLR